MQNCCSFKSAYPKYRTSWSWRTPHSPNDTANSSGLQESVGKADHAPPLQQEENGLLFPSRIHTQHKGSASSSNTPTEEEKQKVRSVDLARASELGFGMVDCHLRYNYNTNDAFLQHTQMTGTPDNHISRMGRKQPSSTWATGTARRWMGTTREAGSSRTGGAGSAGAHQHYRR